MMKLLVVSLTLTIMTLFSCCEGACTATDENLEKKLDNFKECLLRGFESSLNACKTTGNKKPHPREVKRCKWLESKLNECDWDCVETVFTCPKSHEVKCGDGLTCVSKWRMCDGVKHCNDGSDESAEFCQEFTCPGALAKCKDGLQCVQKNELCDGKEHCNDGSDESAHFNCQAKKKIQTDSEIGPKTEIEATTVTEKLPVPTEPTTSPAPIFDKIQVFTCLNSQVKCGNGQLKCVYKWRMCDGVEDCSDGSDESAKFCQGHTCVDVKTKCKDGLQCVHKIELCDGKEHCNDGSDESAHFNCKTKGSGTTEPMYSEPAPSEVFTGTKTMSEERISSEGQTSFKPPEWTSPPNKTISSDGPDVTTHPTERIRPGTTKPMPSEPAPSEEFTATKPTSEERKSSEGSKSFKSPEWTSPPNETFSEDPKSFESPEWTSPPNETFSEDPKSFESPEWTSPPNETFSEDPKSFESPEWTSPPNETFSEDLKSFESPEWTSPPNETFSEDPKSFESPEWTSPPNETFSEDPKSFGSSNMTTPPTERIRPGTTKPMPSELAPSEEFTVARPTSEERISSEDPKSIESPEWTSPPNETSSEDPKSSGPPGATPQTELIRLGTTKPMPSEPAFTGTITMSEERISSEEPKSFESPEWTSPPNETSSEDPKSSGPPEATSPQTEPIRPGTTKPMSMLSKPAPSEEFTVAKPTSPPNEKSSGPPGATSPQTELIINGGWSAFTSWSSCSAECGGGTKTRIRSCNNPAPAYGGNDCPGLSSDSRPCNKDPCPSCLKCGDRKDNCVGQWRVCDGVEDCLNGADESAEFCQAYTCHHKKTKCKDGLQCVPLLRLCNRQVDCNDGSDESAHFKCRGSAGKI